MINSWPDNTSFGRLASLNVNRGGKRVESRRSVWGMMEGGKSKDSRSRDGGGGGIGREELRKPE